MRGKLAPRELWIIAAIILIGVFIVPAGFFSIDDSIYYLGARTISEWGSLGIDNGFEEFQSEGLKLRFLVPGPQGLTPQYPAGSALVAAPLLPLIGTRAFILLNALAGIGTLFVIHRICLNQTGSATVARLAIGLLLAGTFWLEYSLGIWPHVVSVFFAILAYWFTLRHLESEDDDFRPVLLAGLFASLGMLFRIDAILVLPGIGFILAIYARRMFASLAWFMAGALPAFALMSALNYLKFGSLNPLTYGVSGGNVDVTSYSGLFIALCVGFMLLFLFQRSGWKVNRIRVLAAASIAIFALLAIPATRPWLVQFWNGFYALVVDMRTVEDHRRGIHPGIGDTVIFYGLAKKALGQSMPWVGLSAILLTCKVRQRDKRLFATLAILIATMSMPFIWLSWHGGASGNMRYFLPILPALCILCARSFHDLWLVAPKARVSAAAGVSISLALGAAWIAKHDSGYAGLQQIASTWLFIATLLVAVAAGFDTRFSQPVRSLVIALFTAGFTLSACFAFTDFREQAKWRTVSHANSDGISSLPPKSLVITRPEWVADWIPGRGVIAAARDSTTEQIDIRLVEKALDSGYRVFLAEYDVALKVPPGFAPSQTPYAFEHGRAIELRRVKEADLKSIGVDLPDRPK